MIRPTDAISHGGKLGFVFLQIIRFCLRSGATGEAHVWVHIKNIAFSWMQVQIIVSVISRIWFVSHPQSNSYPFDDLWCQCDICSVLSQSLKIQSNTAIQYWPILRELFKLLREFHSRFSDDMFQGNTWTTCLWIMPWYANRATKIMLKFKKPTRCTYIEKNDC